MSNLQQSYETRNAEVNKTQIGELLCIKSVSNVGKHKN